jgi:dynein light chain 1
MPTTIKDAIKKWEQKEGKKAEEATEVKLIGMIPPIDRMDENLNVFENCTKLSLSTNQIERMVALPKLRNLQILSLGRNNIKRILCLDEIGQTLEELWISYNQIEKLDGLQPCVKLRVLYISNNRIGNWGEVQKLTQNSTLRSVLLRGNPIYTQSEKSLDDLALMVLKRVSFLE